MQKLTVLYTLFLLCLCLSANLAAPDVDELSSLAFDYPFANISDANWVNSISHITNFVNTSDGTHIRAILLRNPYNAGYRFACGFVCNGTCDTFLLSIVVIYVNSGSIMRDGVQVVWSANRGNPIHENATLRLTSNGDLRLTDANGTLAWATNTSGMGVASIQLHKSGNLILADASNNTVWQTWDHPTDSLLPGQPLNAGQRLVSSLFTSYTSEGPYFLAIGSDGLGLYASAPGNQQKYWPETTSFNGTYAIFNANTSTLDLFNSSGIVGSSTSISSATPNMSVQFIRIDSDGVLRLYAANDSVIYIWQILVVAPSSNEPCLIPSTCTSYGLCTNDNTVQCSCSYGDSSSSSPFKQVDSTKPNYGCNLSTPLNCNASEQYFLELNNVDYFTVQLHESNFNSTNSLEECKQLCLQDCSCKAAFFRNYTTPSGACYITTEVYTMRQSTDYEVKNNIHYQPTALIKVQNPSVQNTSPASAIPQQQSSNKSLVIGVATGLGVLFLLSLLVFIGCIYWRTATEDMEEDDDPFLKSVPGLPSRFTFQELKDATQSFEKKLGEGGFGSVFLGTLPDGSKIAAKRLEGSSQGQREFRNEVCTIGSIHHLNLVRLCGFCAAKGQRLLVYEFMPNGSLDSWLFPKCSMPTDEDPFDKATKPLLDWPTRFSIALGTAQGLAYLHEECRERIIHFDVKPQNILLDDNFIAKVSDFGLSKFVKRDESPVMTAMRGTIGYLAPEWLHSTVTEKADVYSYGIVLLEIVSGQRCLNTSNPDTGSGYTYLPTFANLKVKQGKEMEMVDERLGGVFDPEEAKRAVYVALWCIQGEPSSRPSMSNVVQMLEGYIPVQSPPLVSGSGGIWTPHNNVGLPDLNELLSSSTYSGSSAEPWSVPAASIVSMPR